MATMSGMGKMAISESDSQSSYGVFERPRPFLKSSQAEFVKLKAVELRRHAEVQLTAKTPGSKMVSR